jgi:hypothetical protein
MEDLVFFDFKSSNCIDRVRIDPCGKYIGAYSGKALAELMEEYGHPQIEVLSWEEAAQLHRAKFIAPPKRISEERFDYLLNVLPPCKWTRHASSESFHVSEHITDDIVTWCVRVGDSYWEISDSCTLTHDELLTLIIKEF